MDNSSHYFHLETFFSLQIYPTFTNIQKKTENNKNRREI